MFIQARNQILFDLTYMFLITTAWQLIYYAYKCKIDWRSLYGNYLPLFKAECDITNPIL